MQSLVPELERRQDASLYRSRILIEDGRYPEIVVDGQRLLAFCSNDYLGMADHPEVIAALQRGADRYGVGSGAAQLVTGHSIAHRALEEELADFTGRARALLFSTGYMANLGIVSALMGRADALFQDRLNHASLIDAARLSQTRLKRYPHGDVAALRRQLDAADRKRRLIASDGVFSMDGDLARLPQLAEAARSRRAWLMVDDAHGLGVLGAEGGGILSHYALSQDQVPILMGTFGKSLGTFGAFVAGSAELIETLIQQARSYIYTTAPPPALAEATRTSLRIVRRDHWRRERLQDLIGRFRRGAEQLGLPLLASQTPIQPLVAGSAERALAWSSALRRRGLLVTAMRPPTVPQGSARLRLTLSAAHTDEHLERLLDGLAQLPREQNW